MNILGKISIVIAALLASSTIFAAADMDSRVTQLENQMQQMRTETARSAQTASARAKVDGHGWSLNFIPLYWHANISGTEFGAANAFNASQIPVKCREKSIDFKWDWGIRVGLGYNFEHDGWDFKGQYTWFKTSGSGFVASGSSGRVIDLRASMFIANTSDSDAELFEYCTNAKSQYDFNYKVMDLELGHAYPISGKASLRPHWGLKTAWIDQEQITRYTGGDTIGANTVHVKDNYKFRGLGPCVGLDSRWYLGYSFSIFSNIAGALFYGSSEVEHKESYTGSKDNQIIRSLNYDTLSPTAQIQFGLCYSKDIHNNTQHIGAGLGFEAQYWWNQKHHTNTDCKYAKDISLYGLTLDIQWDF